MAFLFAPNSAIRGWRILFRMRHKAFISDGDVSRCASRLRKRQWVVAADTLPIDGVDLI